MDFDAQRAIQVELESGERLLWAGRPKQGLRLQAGDAFVIPFSLLWLGFVVFWESSVIRTGSTFFVVWGGLFLLIGLYFAIGRFFADSYARSRTYYGLTDRRVLIRSRTSLKSLPLRSMGEVSMKEQRNRTGTIAFGSATGPYGAFAVRGWPGMERYLPPSFDSIDEVRQVYTQLRSAQEGLRRIGA